MDPRFSSGIQEDDKTREQLLSEIRALRVRNATLEGYKARVEQLESVLRSGEEMSRQFLEQTLYGVWVNVDNRTAFINKEGARILGASHPRDIIGKSVFEFIHPDYREVAKDRIRIIHETGVPMAIVQEKCIRIDGRTVDVDVLLMKFRYEGKPAIFAAFRDITERRQAERALKESEEKFRLLADFTYDWESWIGPDGKYVYVSPAAQRVTGHTAAEFYRDIELLLKLIHPDDLAAYEDHRRCHYAPGSAPGHIDFRIMTKSGKTRWISHLCQSVYGNSGEWMGRRSSNRDITERKRAEEERDRLFDYSLDLLCIIGFDGIFKLVSPSVEKILGWRQEDLLGRSFSDFVYQDDRESTAKMMTEHEAGQEALTFENRYRCKDGSYRWISWNSHPIVAEKIIISVGRDVTERKRSEKALRESEERFRVLAETTTAATVLIRGDRIIYANPATERILGCSKDELLTKKYWEVVHPDSRDLLLSRARMRLEGKPVPSTYEIKFLTKSGETRWGELSAARIEYDGQPTTIATIFDVTERKRVGDALKESESELNKAQRIAHLGSWVWDLASNNVRGSDELYRMFGLTPDPETPLDQFIEQVAPEDRQRLMNALDETVKHNKPFDMEYQVLLPDGTRRFIQDRAEVAYEDGRPATVFGTVLDITERKRAENELKAAKMQADLYVDLMSHDISNMNQVGLGFLEMALDMLELDEMGREMLLKPKSAFENSSKLIDNVKKLQKARSGKYPEMEMDIGQVLGKVRDHYSKQYGPNVTINYLMSLGHMVKANELLYDLFSNIVENAIKHTKAHPMIDIKVEPVRETGRDYHRVTIDDQGPGIPDELKAVIFERKLTGDIKSKGSGIGLYVVKTLVDIYGGRVWVEDRVQGDRTKGARFVVMLPAVEK